MEGPERRERSDFGGFVLIFVVRRLEFGGVGSGQGSEVEEFGAVGGCAGAEGEFGRAAVGGGGVGRVERGVVGMWGLVRWKRRLLEDAV